MPGRRWGESEHGTGWVLLAAVVVAVFPGTLRALLSGPLARTWVTILISVCVQALPFLVLGVLLSGLLEALVPVGSLARSMPRRAGLAVPLGGVAGAALPGCECSSVVVAGRLVRSGVPPAAAVSFLLAAPAINPVVLVATAVAFPGQPRVVLARFAASFLTAVCVGFVWSRRTDVVPSGGRLRAAGSGRLALLTGTVVEDFAQAAAFLVLGAAATATLRVVSPSVLPTAGLGGLLGVPVLGLLAVVLCVCSEADAFVAATLSSFSPVARLAFMVVGPVVDLKLIALQTGTFGAAFARRFVPVTFAVALVISMAVGSALL